ncbi:hypothetical protein [Eubacterium sp.]|uniref:hypothetical protein n=1 Tax=Eubacterium sp. TaxID=142586 RepID=UPI003F053BDC
MMNMNSKKAIIILLTLPLMLCLILLGCKSNDISNNDNSSLISTTSNMPVTEEKTNDGTGFEEDELMDENGEIIVKSNDNELNNQTAKRNDSGNSKSQSTTGSTDFGNTTISDSSSSAYDNQSKAELKTTTTKPKASEQNGEWGTPVKN